MIVNPVRPEGARWRAGLSFAPAAPSLLSEGVTNGEADEGDGQDGVGVVAEPITERSSRMTRPAR